MTQATKKPVYRMENWWISGSPDGTARLRGNVQGHPNIPEQAPATTSIIVLDRSPTLVETNNSVYILGEPYAEPAPAIPYTARQSQAVQVAKAALVDYVKDGFVTQFLPQEVVEDTANSTAICAVDALIKAGLIN